MPYASMDFVIIQKIESSHLGMTREKQRIRLLKKDSGREGDLSPLLEGERMETNDYEDILATASETTPQ